MWRGDRVVDGTGLENRRGATYREFESRPLRHGEQKTATIVAVYFLVKDYRTDAPFVPVPPVPLLGTNETMTKLTAAYASNATIIPTKAYMIVFFAP